MPWNLIWILLIVSAVLCSMGFYKFVYFLSIGYGLSVCGLGITMAVMGLTGSLQLGLAGYLFCALLALYGLRLSGFLLIRELKNIAYRKTLAEATNEDKPMPVFVKATIWILCAVLYVAQVSALLFRGVNADAAAHQLGAWIGLAISLFGVILETVADKQKSAQKAVNPHMVATQGLYKLVRCPNYLGEILFWTGVFVSGLGIYQGFGQWLCAVLAYICIVYIMFNGAQRLEKRQMGRYGKDEAYHQYVNKTPIIIPFVPLYHLNKQEKED